jgi:DNA mismatch repair protein MutH
MLFAMPSYEVKYRDKNEWEEISEINVLGSLQEVYSQVAPVIQEMIDGKQVPTPNAVYRIRGYEDVHFSRDEPAADISSD